MPDPRADVVARQYDRWTYPEPIKNLEGWLRHSWQRFDPSHNHRIFWPDRPYQADIDILIAGCGTNQAAVFAYNNRAARVVGIDVSQTALDHEQYLKDKYALKNLELHHLPIEEVSSLDRDFDLVVSTGVLHHLAEPEAGMRALADVLRPEGVLGIMLYALYGRTGVESMQGVFREMGLTQDEDSLHMVKQAIAVLPQAHPLRSYLAIAPDLEFDAGLVDTFLHGRDRAYTVEDCLELVGSAGLVFQDWLLNTSYHPLTLVNPDSEFYAAVDRLPREKMWSVMERINTLNACHFFMATRADRDPAGYRIDFSAANALDYVPLFRLRSDLAGDEIFRPGWRLRFSPVHLAFAREIDAERSIRDIATRVAESGVVGGDQSELEDIALHLFEGLWRTDFIAIDLSRAVAS